MINQYLILAPFCAVSCLANVSIVVTFMIYEDLKSIYEYQFILIFACFDFLTCLSSILPSMLYENNDNLCIAQGILIQIFSLSGILWIGFIAIAMFREMILVRKRFSNGFFKPLLVIISFSIFTALVPYFYNAYKPSGAWCWFENPNGSGYVRNYLFRFLLFYVIVWVIIVLNFAVSLMIRNKKKKEVLYDFKGNRLVNRLKWYPWILCFCFTPLTIVRFLEGFLKFPAWFIILCSIILRCMALINSIAFFHSDKVRAHISSAFSSQNKPKTLQESSSRNS